METENKIFESSEWQSTPEIIKITFKSLFDLTQTHSALIKQLEEQIATKSSKFKYYFYYITQLQDPLLTIG